MCEWKICVFMPVFQCFLIKSVMNTRIKRIKRSRLLKNGRLFWNLQKFSDENIHGDRIVMNEFLEWLKENKISINGKYRGKRWGLVSKSENGDWHMRSIWWIFATLFIEWICCNAGIGQNAYRAWGMREVHRRQMCFYGLWFSKSGWKANWVSEKINKI